METNTHTIAVQADRDAVFAYISDLDNMPRWAVNFCRSVERRDGFTYVITPQGPLIFLLKADERTGVIDFVGGPSTVAFTRWLSRVVAAPGGGALFMFTAIRQPGQDLGEFTAQCDLLSVELQHLKEQIENASAMRKQ